MLGFSGDIKNRLQIPENINMDVDKYPKTGFDKYPGGVAY